MKQSRFECFRDPYGGDAWYWRLVGKNGKILADGGESYKRRAACLKAVERVVREAQEALKRGVFEIKR